MRLGTFICPEPPLNRLKPCQVPGTCSRIFKGHLNEQIHEWTIPFLSKWKIMHWFGATYADGGHVSEQHDSTSQGSHYEPPNHNSSFEISSDCAFTESFVKAHSLTSAQLMPLYPWWCLKFQCQEMDPLPFMCKSTVIISVALKPEKGGK